MMVNDICFNTFKKQGPSVGLGKRPNIGNAAYIRPRCSGIDVSADVCMYWKWRSGQRAPGDRGEHNGE